MLDFYNRWMIKFSLRNVSVFSILLMISHDLEKKHIQLRAGVLLSDTKHHSSYLWCPGLLAPSLPEKEKDVNCNPLRPFTSTADVYGRQLWWLASCCFISPIHILLLLLFLLFRCVALVDILGTSTLGALVLSSSCSGRKTGMIIIAFTLMPNHIQCIHNLPAFLQQHSRPESRYHYLSLSVLH